MIVEIPQVGAQFSMPFNSDVRSYLLQSVDGRLLLGNAVGGARLGLYARASAFSYLVHAYQVAGGAGADRLQFESSLADCRFEDIAHDAPQRVVSNIVPLPFFNQPNVRRWYCYTVIPLSRLGDLISQDDKDRMGVEFPSDGRPKVPAEFLEAVDSLGKRGRHFQLATGKVLGRGLLWFTTRNAIGRIRAACLRLRRDLAGGFCDGLGLGHRQIGDWLVLLTIPGVAIQAAGHYRPTFCDAWPKGWFMARSSSQTPAVRRKPRTWGQTADLSSLASGNPSYDGGTERVSLCITSSHLGAAMIEFEVLGPVGSIGNAAAVRARLANDVWRRRRSR